MASCFLDLNGMSPPFWDEMLRVDAIVEQKGISPVDKIDVLLGRKPYITKGNRELLYGEWFPGGRWIIGYRIISIWNGDLELRPVDNPDDRARNVYNIVHCYRVKEIRKSVSSEASR